MSHYLTKLRIQNYCSCNDTEIVLKPFTPLVGYNNAGKSNILSAIQWLLRKSTLDKGKFNDKYQPVYVNGEITGISNEILDGLPQNQRNAIEQYIVDEKLTIRRFQPSPGCGATMIKLQVRRPEAEADADDEWNPNPAGIDNAISALFPEPIVIDAMENATEDVGKFSKSSTIGKLISEIIKPIEEQHGAEIKETLERLERKLAANGEERAPELQDFDDAANNKLQDLFPGLKVKLHVPSPSIDAVFKSGTVRIYEDGYNDENEEGREIGSLGHGAQRSIQMALVRHLAEVKRADGAANTNTLLLIDEPELYLHPQAIEYVRIALKNLSTEGYQVVFSTHSAQMITASDVPSTLLIRKSVDDGTFARKRLEDVVQEVVDDNDTQLDILFSLTNSNKILFSERVILAEGKTERKLLPVLFEKAVNTTLEEKKLALVELQGAGSASKCLDVLVAMDLPAKAIVDLDFAFRGAISSGLIQNNDEDIVACRAYFAEVAGDNNIALDVAGLPTKVGNSLTAAQAFEYFGAQPDLRDKIDNLHAKLLNQNVWLWKKGTIETHIGLQSKNNREIARFSRRLDGEPFNEVVVDHASVIRLSEWLME